ncbi:alpha-1,3-mannosyl-glycoprotein 4-beta-N-acetylglucosaminyltransferase B [Eurytemora carolleeae]|uniref:alpha-1,3-mannosyl-glycoprotein 4-beta-N-acetylglucosaminyltransferase B n=1 Tax=Eurytemora carolleeae TaxID=1294199 RepID=UPI000C789926|nr:alpha-1,3-mannosyl-glycoprotein 4-beta-N-acetylglucosaminyltransferase B [Eurytemora carolleeae]|eukprot:XP_023327106.1 alpha-1,3-mannosyl-glycoprotein 4-beta-N-acetylglucosaminyltransferase B-like [Eurytemora affinis]
MFRSTDLPWLVQFFLMFYNDKPVDWLLVNILQTKVCKLDQDNKKCKKEEEKLWIHYKPSLFQHIGTHSSLKGKVQKLKDRQFGRVQLFTPHKNPPAKIESPIKHYKHYSIERAYKGDTFFWGLVPQPGDQIIFQFQPPLELESFKFVTGNLEHPSDRYF